MRSDEKFARITDIEGYAPHSMRKRFLCASLSLVTTTSLTVTCSFATVSAPVTSFQAGTPVVHHVHAAGSPANASHTNVSTSSSPSAIQTSTKLHPVVASSASTAKTSAYNLDLLSSTATYSAGAIANFHTITIDVGGKSEQVSLNTKLSGAELVAAQQVLSGGTQTIKINGTGIATGGYFDLNTAAVSQIDSALGGNISSLYIPHNVKVVDDLSSLNLSGSLVNYGSLVAVAVNSSAGHSAAITDAITASNIFNAHGGLIESLSSTGVHPNLNLDASSLLNSGIISSAGTLNIAASTLTNQGGTVSAAQTVTVHTPSLVNSGLIRSDSGDIDVVSTNKSLTLEGTGGTLSATQGNINFDSTASNGNISINGGNLVSHQVNFNAGTGNVNASLNNVTGVVNATADNAHIGGNSANLVLGKMDVADDPTYWNTGNIVINGSIAATPGQDLAIIAGGNIIGGGGFLDTSSSAAAGAGANGGNLTLVAGADFTTSNMSNSGSNSDGTITVTVMNSAHPGEGSSTGGYIDLKGNSFGEAGGSPVTTITTSSLNGAAGYVNMVAYAGTGAHSGSIVMPSSTSVIDATGATGNGDVSIIAGGSGGKIALGNIEAGNVYIYGATPTLAGGSATFSNGTSSGGFNTFSAATGSGVDGYATKSTAVQINTIDSSVNGTTGGSVLITTGGSVTSTSINVSGRGGASGSAGQAGGLVGIQAGLGITSGSIDAAGGGGGGGAGGENGGAGGNGGSVTLIAHDGSISSNGIINVSAGGGGGGGGPDSGGTAGNGGAGGTAGVVYIQTPLSYISVGSIQAYDGGAGGAGAASDGPLAGGGGGGGGSYGGGGGGGAAGAPVVPVPGVYAVGGAGGGGSYGGGGGGGSSTGAVTLSGGTGGSGQNPAGALGGTGDGPGGQSGVQGQPSGSGGNPTGSGLTTPAGSAIGNGGSGGASEGYTGLSGTNATTQGGAGQVSLSVGATSGSAGKPLEIDTASLSVNSIHPASVYVTDKGGPLTLNNSTIVGGTLSVSSAGDLTIAGALSAGTVNLTATPSAATEGAVTIGDNITASTVTINANSSVTNSNPNALITATTAIINASGANGISLSTDVSNISLHSTAVDGNITVLQQSAPAKTLDILTSSIGSGGTLAITSNGQINVEGAISAAGATVNITSTSPSAPIGAGPGILVANNISAQSVTLSTADGTGNILESPLKVVTAATITLNSGGNIGTTTERFETNASTLVVISGTSAYNPDTGLITNSAYIADLNPGTITVSGGPSGQFSGTFSLVSSSQTLNTGSLIYNTISISDKLGAVDLNSAASNSAVIGSGSGNITITARGDINEGVGATKGLNAVALSLDSTTGSIGNINALAATADTIVADAAATAGTVALTVTNSVLSGDTTISGTAGNSFTATTAESLSASTIHALAVNLTSTSANVSLIGVIGETGSNVSITSAGTISQAKTAETIGASVSLDSTVSTGSFGSSGQNLVTEAQAISVNGAEAAFIHNIGSVSFGQTPQYATSSGTAVSLSATGNVTVSAALDFTGATSSVTITTPDKVVIGADVEGNTISIAGSSIAAGGQINATTLSLQGGTISVSGTINATSTLTFSSLGNLAINGTGTITPGTKLDLTATKGAIELGGTSGNPLSSLSSATTNFNQITIKAEGDFTSPFSVFAVAPASATGDGGVLSIQAANIVNTGTASGFSLSANGTGSGTAGSVTLKLTGSENISTGTGVGQYQFSAAGTGTGGDGTVSVTVAGNLTVNSGSDITVASNAAAGTQGTLVLASSHDLAVKAPIILSYGTVELSSGSISPFVVGGATTPVNGVEGSVSAATVAITDILGITISSSGTISSTAVAAASGPNAGNINLFTEKLTNDGTLSFLNGGVATAVTTLNAVSNNGSLDMLTGSKGVYSGETAVNFEAVGSLYLNSLFTTAQPLATAQSITLTALSGPVYLSSSVKELTAAANPTTGNGGTIFIETQKFSVTSPSTGFALNAAGTTADGGTTGNGGSVTLVSIAPITVGDKLGDFFLNVGAAEGANGGSVNVETAFNLKVDGTNGFNFGGTSSTVTTPTFATNSGPNLTLAAGLFGGSGNLLVENAPYLSAGTGQLGIVILESNSATPFTLSNATTNGIVGTGGIISTNINVTNLGGGIVNGTGTGTKLDASGITSGNATSTVIVQAASNIGTAISQIETSSIQLAINSQFGSAYVHALTTPTGSTTLIGPGSNSPTHAAGTLNLTVDGGLTAEVQVSAPTLIINGAGALSGSFNITASNISGNLSSTTSAPTFIDTSKSATIAGFTTGGSLTFEGSGSVLVSAPITATSAASSVSITAGNGGGTGSITLNSGIVLDGGLATGTGKIALGAGGSTGNIVMGSGTYSLQGSEVQLTAINSTASTTPLRTETADLSLIGGFSGSSEGNFNVANTYSGAVTLGVPNGDNVGSLNFSSNGSTSLTVNSISSTNSITISTNSGSLNVASDASVRTNNESGNAVITLQNTNTSSGTITVGDGASMVSDTIFGTAGVNIVVGAVPTVGQLLNGVSPANPGNYTSTPEVTFGSTNNPSGTITINGTGTHLNGDKARVVFNGNAQNITLDGSDTITADPPTPGTAAFTSAISAFNNTSVNSNPSSVASSITNATSSAVSAPLVRSAASFVEATGISAAVSGATPPTGMSSSASGRPSASGSSGSGITAIGSFGSATNSSASSALNRAPIESLTPATVNGGLSYALNSSSTLTNQNSGTVAQSDLNAAESQSALVAPASASSSLRTDRVHKGIISNTAFKTLERGVMLISPDQPTVIQTGYGTVGVAAGAVALLVSFDRGVAVYDLHDSRRNSVTMNYRHHCISLAPGQHALFTDRDVKYFEEVNAIGFVGYRKVAARDLGDGVKSFISEFNIPSLVHGLKPLQQLFGSPEAKTQKLAAKMLKTTALVSQMAGNSEPYELMTGIPVTAVAEAHLSR